MSSSEIHNDLFQKFLLHDGSNAHQGLAPSYYATVDKELDALQASEDSLLVLLHDTAHRAEETSYRDVQAVDRPQRFMAITSALSAKVWGTYALSRDGAKVRTRLKKEAIKVGRVRGLEVVRKQVNPVA